MPESFKRKLGDELNMQLHLERLPILGCFTYTNTYFLPARVKELGLLCEVWSQNVSGMLSVRMEEWLLHTVYSIVTQQPGG